jgi:hypothetical protein
MGVWHPGRGSIARVRLDCLAVRAGELPGDDYTQEAGRIPARVEVKSGGRIVDNSRMTLD